MPDRRKRGAGCSLPRPCALHRSPGTDRSSSSLAGRWSAIGLRSWGGRSRQLQQWADPKTNAVCTTAKSAAPAAILDLVDGQRTNESRCALRSSTRSPIQDYGGRGDRVFGVPSRRDPRSRPTLQQAGHRLTGGSLLSSFRASSTRSEGVASWLIIDPRRSTRPVARRLVEPAWGAVLGLFPVRFPRPLAEPAVPISRQQALHDVCR